ncbi:uncharacterized protein [Drosophila bipectinata]|uniref:uncharacterized protein n=1 Tax=Drosophila bipectinata TaxID=42026 RepID=UPI0038B2A3F7
MTKPKPASTSSAESETMANGGNADSLFALQKDLHNQLNQLQQFNKNHQEFVSAGYPIHPYFVDNLADQFEEEFITAFCLISTESETLFPNQLPACAEQQATPVPKTLGPGAAVQLPKLPVPNFSGKYTDWPAFHDLFMQLIHQNQALSNIQRFHFLKQALPKEQDQDVHQMELTDGAYTIAWDLIIKRYNNPRLQFMHHMNALYDLPFISRESSSEIKHMLNVTNVCINEFNRLKTNIQSSTQWIVHHLIARLPTTTVQAWEHCLGNSSDIPSFTDLETFLNNRLVSMNIIENRKSSQPTQNSTVNKSTNYPRQNPKQKGSGFYKGSTFHTTTGPSGPISCVHCKGQHILRRCPDFLSKDCFARKRIIDHTKACLNCLSIHHPLSQCGSNKNCLQCGQRHHTLLHFPTTYTSPSPIIQNAASESSDLAHPSDSTTVLMATAAQSTRSILLATALVQLHNNSTGQTAVIRALIDHGSEGTLITERAAQLLGLPRHRVTAQITGVGDNSKNICRFSTEFSISSCTDPQFHHLVRPAYVLNSITSHLPRSNVNVDTCQHLQGLHLADPTFTRPGRIDALFGVDLIQYLLLPDLRKGASNQPIAQLTQLGWIVFGHSNETRANVVTIRCHQTNLDALVKGFFDLDQISSERTLTAEEQWCEDHFQRTCTRQPNGKYLVRLPLKTEFDKEQVIGKSHQIALNRFHLLERRLNRNDTLKQQYHSTIKEYFDLKQLSKVTTAETRHQMITPRGQQYFSSCTLPHHAVIKEDSTTTKVRVVYDASCTTSNGKSLNDILCIGPPLQNDLGGVIMKWRLHRYVFAADIQRMYRCIDMHQEDAQFQRILWRNDQNEIAEYSLNTVTFGTASAPYTAIRVIRQLAHDEQHRYPLATPVLLNEVYVDDVQTGHNTVHGALEIRNQLIATLKSAGMELRKWASNHPQILSGIPDQHMAQKRHVEVNFQETIKTLGLYWSPHEDLYSFKVRFDLPASFTKRSFLSVVARLYDPLGFIVPVTTAAKSILKDIWQWRPETSDKTQTALDWDGPLPPILQARCEEFRHHLPNIEQLKIPRWLGHQNGEPQSHQLHVFCDGSSQAYAACVYLRIQYPSGRVSTALLTARSRVTPTKPLTIPRIELSGAVLAAQLAKWVLTQFSSTGIPMSVNFWTDASIVLYWIKGNPTRWKTFVSNRIGKILELSTTTQWQHVPSGENPADCASRGLTPHQLARHDIWWFGPDWLRQDENRWPKNTCSPPPDQHHEERRQPTNITAHVCICITYATHKNFVMWARFEYQNYEKLYIKS